MLKSKGSSLPMQWIKEIETANITPRSILGRTDFLDHDELDAMMASALRKLFDQQTRFRKKASVEEQRAQNHDRFFRGRQIALMMYDHFRSTGSYDGVQGLSDLFSTRLHNDDVQDFDVRCDRAISSTCVTPASKILEGLYKSKLQDSTQLQTLLALALFNKETIRSGGEPDFHRLRTCVKLHVDQTLRNKNSKIHNEMVRRVAVTKGFKRNKPFVERRVVLSLESKWIMFKRGVLQFPLHPSFGQPLRISR